MRNEDKPQFAKLMVALGEYYSKEVSDGLIGIYWSGLQHFDLPAVREAMNRHMQNADSGQFMPKIADISKMLSGTTQDRALQAWSKVDRAVRAVGNYRSVVFDDPLVHRVIQEMGGWVKLGTKTEDEWPFVAKEFENRYRGYSARSETPEYPPVLIGISEAQNSQKGFEVEPPTLIGNPEQAKITLSGGTSVPLIGIERLDVAGAAKLIESKQ